MRQARMSAVRYFRIQKINTQKCILRIDNKYTMVYYKITEREQQKHSFGNSRKAERRKHERYDRKRKKRHKDGYAV